MRLREAKALKVGDMVYVPHLGLARGKILAVMPDKDPRVKCVVRIVDPVGMTFTLNYKLIRRHKHD